MGGREDWRRMRGWEVGEDGEHGEDGCEDGRLGGWEDGCEDGMMGGWVGGWYACVQRCWLCCCLSVVLMPALMVVVLTRASMLVELMSVFRFVGLIFGVMLVALSGMMSCVVMDGCIVPLMLVVVLCIDVGCRSVISWGGAHIT